MRNRHLLSSVIILLSFRTAVLHGGSLYVLPSAGAAAQTVSVLDSDTLANVSSFDIPSNAVALYPNPSNTKLYVVSGNPSDAVVVFAAGTSTRIRTIPQDVAPTASVMTPDGSRLAVLAGKLHIYNTKNDSEVTPSAGLDVGGWSSQIVSDLSSSRILVLDPDRQTLSAVDLAYNSVADSPLRFESAPFAMAVGPNGLLYVSAVGKVYVVDVRALTIRAEIPVVGTPGRLVFTPDGLRAVAVNQNVIAGKVLFVFDLAAATVAGVQPYGSSYSVDYLSVVGNNAVYLASQFTPMAYKLSLNPISLTSAAFAISPSSGYAGLVTSSEVPTPVNIYSLLVPGTVYRYSSANPTMPGSAVTVPSGGSLFFHEVTTGAPATLLRFGDGQTVAPGGISAPLVVQVLDRAGKPVNGTPMVFSTSTPGAAVVGCATATSTDGYVLAYVRVPTKAGTVTVTATSSADPSITTTFTLNVATGSGGGTGGKGSVEIASGNGQVTVMGQTTNLPLRVVVKDSSGTPVSGSQVVWTVPSGKGNLTSYTSTTDANGQAETYYIGVVVGESQSYDQVSVTATATEGVAEFVVTSIPSLQVVGRGMDPYPNIRMLTPEPGVGKISGKLGQVLPGAIQVQITAVTGSQPGAGIPNVGLTLTSTVDPKSGPVPVCVGGTVLSDANGIATCNVKITGHQGDAGFYAKVGGDLGWTLLVSAVPGDPGEIKIVQGDKQSGTAGAQLPLQLVGEISDGYGNIIAGSEVAWEVVTPGSLSLSDKVEKADSNGRISARVTLGNISGSFLVKVHSKAGTAVGVFTVYVNIPASNLVKAGGDNQNALIGADFAQPLAVQVVDGQNKGIQGIAVAFAVASGSATLTSATVTTGTDGKASTSVRAGASAGPIAVTASIEGFAVTFRLSAALVGSQLTAAVFVNGAGGQPGVVPGSIVTIYGQGIAPNISGSVTPGSAGGPLPLKLADVEVTFGSTPAPIFNVSNVRGMQSVTVQAPFELSAPGLVSVTIRVGGGSTVVANVPTLALQPGLFETVGASGSRSAVAVGDDGRNVLPGAGARRGEVVRVFVTGLGQSTPATATNQVGIPGQKAAVDVVVGLNNEGVRLVSAEYMVGVAGIYVVTFEVPATSASGDLPFVVAAFSADGSLVFSNASKLAVQ